MNFARDIIFWLHWKIPQSCNNGYHISQRNYPRRTRPISLMTGSMYKGAQAQSSAYLGPPDPHVALPHPTPAPSWGSGLVWQDFLAPVQHFVRRKMWSINLETTSPPEVVSRCKIAQINQEVQLYKYTRAISLKHTDNCFKECGTL